MEPLAGPLGRAIEMEYEPEKARWEPAEGTFTLVRRTGRATLLEVEAMMEAILGATMRAAIVLERSGVMRELRREWFLEELEKWCGWRRWI